MNDANKKPIVTIHEVFIYLCVDDPQAAIDFYRTVFGAEEQFRLTEPSGKIGHAELKLGPATIMLAGEYPEYDIHSPRHYGGTGVRIHLHVDDVDSLAQRAVDAGAEMLREPTDEPHGERQCKLRDPFGHEWLLGHSIEEVSPEEMQRRFTESFQNV
ncbi:VOC family protein [Fodinibius salsisoli]|uniref:VOC family protein n=1 Tax=Fodinibius salsisoli TaxID=2820877 RepID=A0ABT3PHV8_9BACT|nr:VOC family protein [Fodinibius salsisoli]MCW9705497.1 VOC family protein [Fodinibius salsisoli]